MQAHASYVDALTGDAPPEPRADAPTNPPETSEIAQDKPADEGAPSFARTLLEGRQDGATLRDDAQRFAAGLALSALYGLSIGTRAGGLSILKHAAAVPLAPLAVAGLGVPALFIVLTLFDAPVDPPAAVKAAARGAATTGLVLGGLAPAMALFVTTSSSHVGAGVMAGLGLILAGIFGLRAFLGALGTPLGRASSGVRTMSGFALTGFAVFAIALSARVWWSTLPIFGGDL
ncbi:hypothetical protein [Polyangium spumosum]|uniref:Uncharacterized protein n=1 Tax=Polyangium spumosum TaxID=889282 RepID=A0A6N7Q404_9BACT|nr:hypothetical protein [Polyangium spumosum]MRG98437.1 hypothetical protein [Polyangium spumosum]